MEARRQSAASLEVLTVRLRHEAPAGRTVGPIDVAKAFAAPRGDGNLAWRSHLHDVRGSAVNLALAGKLITSCRGKMVDPGRFRGAYRLG
jgi:Protein of unknown function (DUF3253)